MEINYKEIAEEAVAYAKRIDLELDYTAKSIETLDFMLDLYHENLDEFEGTEGADYLWDLAVIFGIYLGEMLLRDYLEEKGFAWYLREEFPVLKNGNMEISPITKVHKQMLNGQEDTIKSFSKFAIMIADGEFPPKKIPVKAEREIDIELESGYQEKNVSYDDIHKFVQLIVNGEEDFLILSSKDGFLQFYGIDDQFIADTRVNLSNGDFRTYELINKAKEQKTQRVKFETPFGEFTPQEREIVSLETIHLAIKSYYENGDYDRFLQQIPYIDSTEETKRCMGLSK